MTWTLYLASIAFFSFVFLVFYAIAWSTFLGIYENYLRYYQKASLQWTGPDSRFSTKRIRPGRLLVAAVLTAWLVVHLVSLR